MLPILWIAEGVLGQVKGKFQKGYGDLKETVKKKVDSMLDDKKKGNAA